MILDLRLAFRRFRFKPAHTLLMILILGIGIGATTAVFSVVDQTVLRPAPFAYADRLVDVLDIARPAEEVTAWRLPRYSAGSPSRHCSKNSRLTRHDSSM